MSAHAQPPAGAAAQGSAHDMRVRMHPDIADIDPREWDSLAHPSIYLSWDWLRARSSTIHGRSRFFVVSDGSGRPVVAAPSYVTDHASHPSYDPVRILEIHDLDDAAIEATSDERATVTRLRELLAQEASSLRPGLVVCSPGLMGGVSYAPGMSTEERDAPLTALADSVETQAIADGVATIVWSFMIEGADLVIDRILRERGYTSVVIGADCYLPIVWRTIDEYFARFSRKRRHTFLYEMRALARAGVSVDLCGSETLGPELARLELQWRHRYGRRATLEETLANYQQLRDHFGARLLVFVARRSGRPVGFLDVP